MKCIKCGAPLPDNSLYCNICGVKQIPKQHNPKRRGNGQGTIYKEGKTYTAVKQKFVNGERITRKKRGFKTLAAANEWLLSASLKRNKTNITLLALYEKWLPTHKASKSTLDCYVAGFNVFSDFFYTPIEELEIDALQEALDESEKGKRTKQNAKIALNLVFKYGIPRGYVPENLNLAQFLKVRAESKPLKRGFSAAELDKIHSAIGKHPFAEIVYCHCYLGFRPSALLALTVADYDKENKTLIGGIKTEAGKNRLVTISPKIQQLVEARIREFKDDYIFGEDGFKMTLKKYRSGFYSLMEELKIKTSDEHGNRVLSPHSCRHTFATLMKNIEAPEKNKMALIGHASSTMLRHYEDIPNIEELKKITDIL